jgi:hypothetical protein
MTRLVRALVVGGAMALLCPAVAAADILAPNARPFSAFEGGSTGDQRIATFSDAPPCDKGDYTATVDWGDGQVSAGNVVKDHFIADGQCVYDIEDRHTYRLAGSYNVTATICGRGQCVTTPFAGTASVGDAQVRGETASFQAVAGRAFAGRVAEINDDNRESVGGDFTTTIDWGDGTTSPGTVSGANGRHEVGGSHTYAAPGVYRVQVTAFHGGRAIVLDAGTAQVVGAALAPSTSAPPATQNVTATASLRLTNSRRFSRAGLRRKGLRVRIRVGSFRGRRLSYRIRDARSGRTVFRGRVAVGRVRNGVATVRVRFSKRKAARLRRNRSYAFTLPRQGGLPTLQTRFRVVR